MSVPNITIPVGDVVQIVLSACTLAVMILNLAYKILSQSARAKPTADFDVENAVAGSADATDRKFPSIGRQLTRYLRTYSELLLDFHRHTVVDGAYRLRRSLSDVLLTGGKEAAAAPPCRAA
ncbi:hypothetical protein BZA05DRAFT_422407 [Tricharina praecox]|uniref:uncharacterized protein n=1 Tax=Tricharina praecox TaxID=43433 RepID=UPI002220C4C9|nr:uncharacterized protein BZA05DRAFT_422407 [Tricharina praecox]KAI5842767.1 hypothetical protein BZA05DRAFT_422407 [Tricharina praecox]